MRCCEAARGSEYKYSSTDEFVATPAKTDQPPWTSLNDDQPVADAASLRVGDVGGELAAEVEGLANGDRSVGNSRSAERRGWSRATPRELRSRSASPLAWASHCRRAVSLPQLRPKGRKGVEEGRGEAGRVRRWVIMSGDGTRDSGSHEVTKSVLFWILCTCRS